MTYNPNRRTSSTHGLGTVLVAAVSLALAPVVTGTTAAAQGSGPSIRVVSDESGQRLQVDGEDLMVLGINWDYFPIGSTNPAYNFWGQPDAFIEAALDREMGLLQAMGVNVIRVYVGIPARWIEYIYDNYGIWTVLNHAMARYGYTLDGVWLPNTDYSNPRLRAAVQNEVLGIVEEFKNTRGLLMWLLGNENNYGLEWSSAETENLPQGEANAVRARYLYSMFGEVGRAIKAADPNHPVAMANGDLQYINIIAEETRGGLDVFGTNTYRGISFRDLYTRVRDELGLPVMLTEFGADAWDARRMQEDQVTQARYLIEQWREVYENAAGKGLANNSIGAMTFQWTDGWWKYRQTENLDIHDTNASWANDGYPEDFVEGRNNMNEEWWGIAAKGPTDVMGFYEIYPRAAFYALQQAYTLDPYAPDTDIDAIREHFGAISPMGSALQARGDRASLLAETASRIRVDHVRVQFETFNTGGTRTSTPSSNNRGTGEPAFRGFDYMQSFYAGVSAQPTEQLSARFSFNVLGHVPENRIEEIFYEKVGQPETVQGTTGPVTLGDLERVRVYRASVRWDADLFGLEGFYRTGHYHWGVEGDFFGLYREANYGPNIDIYNGEAPFGVEVTGRGALDGFAVAFGPELWWGANPAVVARYGRQIGGIDVTAVYHEDLTARVINPVSSFAIPEQKTRRASLQMSTDIGPFGVELGGLWSGNTKVGDTYQIAELNGGTYTILQDEIGDTDTFGGKARLTYSAGRLNWYAEGAMMGIVADAGPPNQLDYTGWSLKNWGSGNNNLVRSGFTFQVGDFQIGPNFLWQKPIVGPIPAGVPAPGRPRNIIDDPFAVRGGNREMIAGELMITFDPDPGTWLWQWDNVVREGAGLAASLGIVFRHLPTTQDAAIGILADGRTPFAFPGATPARDVWEVNARFVGSPSPGFRYNVTVYGGEGEPNGDSQRLINRYGGEATIAVGSVMFRGYAKINDWGTFDYHRDFNLTFPLQFMADLSHSVGAPQWFDTPQTRIGLRALWRSLDANSNRFCPVVVTNGLGVEMCNPSGPGSNGNEWEIRTYLDFAI